MTLLPFSVLIRFISFSALLLLGLWGPCMSCRLRPEFRAVTSLYAGCFPGLCLPGVSTWADGMCPYEQRVGLLTYSLLWKQITQVPGFLRLVLTPSAVPWIVKCFPCDPGLCCVPRASTKQRQANLFTSGCGKVRSQRLGTVFTNTSGSALSGGTGSTHPCSLPRLGGRVPFSFHYEWR